jgi:hypothetical protein
MFSVKSTVKIITNDSNTELIIFTSILASNKLLLLNNFIIGERELIILSAKLLVNTGNH